MQQKEGSFRAAHAGTEADTRFVFCACAISAILNDWSGVNIDLTVSFIRACITYEGGIALLPGSEAHGGSTYCGLAALSLMGRLSSLTPSETKRLEYWCLQR